MRTHNAMLAIAIAIVAGVLPGPLRAKEQSARATRVDAGAFFYDFSEGGDSYGPWWGGRLKLTNRPPVGLLGFTGILEVVTERIEDEGEETDGVFFAGTGYHDWSESFFTLSSVGTGSNLPFSQFNVHHEFNAKVGPKREIVLSAGGGYVDYHDANQNTYWTLGSTYYWSNPLTRDSRVVLQYQYRHYYQKPVDDQFGSHIVALEFADAEANTLNIRYLHGKEIFQAGGAIQPLVIADLTGDVLTVGYERPIGNRFGFGAAVDFLQQSANADDVTLYGGMGFELRLFRNI